MEMRDLLVMVSAAKTVHETREFLAASYDGLQLHGGNNVKQIADAFGSRLFGKNNGRIPELYTVIAGVPVYALLVHTVKDKTPPPSECFKLHLCTNDPTGELI